MRMIILFVLIVGAGYARAESEVDIQIRNSYLALSAFECAIVAPDDNEIERLFMLGLTAGRDFVSYVSAHPASYPTDFHPKVALVWNTTGPSVDFILGQIYAMCEEEVYKKFDPDDQVWKAKKATIYRDKNCALIGK